MNDSIKLPVWFRIVSIAFLIWNAIGIFFFYTQISMSPAELVSSMGKASADTFAAMPQWQWWAYGIAVWSGTFAGIALLLRRAWAQPLFLVSLIAVVIQYGYSFGVLKIQNILGWSAAAPLPVFIVVMAALGLWFARWTTQKGWLS